MHSLREHGKEGEVMRKETYEEYVTRASYDETLERISEAEYFKREEENN